MQRRRLRVEEGVQRLVAVADFLIGLDRHALDFVPAQDFSGEHLKIFVGVAVAFGEMQVARAGFINAQAAGTTADGATSIVTGSWTSTTLNAGDVVSFVSTTTPVNSVNPQSYQSTGQTAQFVVTATTADAAGTTTPRPRSSEARPVGWPVSTLRAPERRRAPTAQRLQPELRAQKIILKELDSQFGGSAKAQATEAAKLGIPVIGVVDTNHSPEGVTYIIPGNDDSSKAITLYARGVADAILEGRSNAAHELVESVKGGADEFVEVSQA